MTTNLRLPGRPEELTLPALLARNAAEHGDLPALSWREGADAHGLDDPHLVARSAARWPSSPPDTPPSASDAASTSC